MARARLTVTISEELGRFLEELAIETGENKSVLVGRALEELRKRHLEALLRAGYEEMTAHDLELARELEHVDRGTPWPEYTPS
jgi:predicted transcriptional regulator